MNLARIFAVVILLGVLSTGSSAQETQQPATPPAAYAGASGGAIPRAADMAKAGASVEEMRRVVIDHDHGNVDRVATLSRSERWTHRIAACLEGRALINEGSW